MKEPIKINTLISGSRGYTKKLMEIHGEQKVKEYWIENGNRKTAKFFGVSPWTITHCRKKYQWKRPLEKVPNILKAVARGNADPKNYPHLEFKVANSTMLVPQQEDIQRHAYYMMKKGTFIGWCLLNHGYTYCDNIYRWFEGDPKMDWVESYEDLIKAIKDDKSGYFLLRHFNKVETANKHYTERTSGFLFED